MIGLYNGSRTLSTVSSGAKTISKTAGVIGLAFLAFDTSVKMHNNFNANYS